MAKETMETVVIRMATDLKLCKDTLETHRGMIDQLRATVSRLMDVNSTLIKRVNAIDYKN